MRVPRRLRAPLLGALHFLWPTDCFVCEDRLPLDQCAGACLACWTRLRPLRGFCPRCGEPRGASDLLDPSGLACAGCLLRRGPLGSFLGVRPAVPYDALARRFLLRAKLSPRPEILPLLGTQLATALSGSPFAEGCQAVVAVPSHPLSRLRRGFDPAREIARPVAVSLGLPLVPALRRRLGSGGAVKRLSAVGRARALQGAFAGGTRRRLPAKVLLVDDVLTTGATAAACVPVLRDLGAAEVRLAVWARTPRRPPI